MPYIPNEVRLELNSGQAVASDPGELNYVITKIVLQYIEAKGKNYSTFNDAVGALECSKQELYRRLVVPYEITKTAMNGDVFNERH